MDPSAIHWLPLSIGVVIGVFGWMIYWTGIRVIGSFMGLGVGAMIGNFLSTRFDWDDYRLALFFGGALLGAVAGFYLIRLVQYYFFFIIGACMGAPAALYLQTAGPLANLGWSQSPWFSQS